MKLKLLLLAMAMYCLVPLSSTHAQTAQFNQLNFDYNGTFTPYSDWGALDLTFTGTPTLMYLNLTVDTAWVIENMPVQSLRGIGLLQTQRFWFPIGPDGVPVSSLIYELTFTPGLGTKPTATTPATVLQDTIIIDSGIFPLPPGGINKPDPAEKQKGDPPVEPPQKHENFPNQEAGKNECVPVGVSNSLQFLNNKHGLGMPAGAISIANLKNGTGWTPNGCPRHTWIDLKRNYIRNAKLPITTRKFTGLKGLKALGAEIQAGQDVEMDIKWKGPGAHCVAVTSWENLGGGKYKITITHDGKQGKAGGLVDEPATYDANTGKWTGALAAGTSDFYFAVECPAKKCNQPNNNIPGGNILKAKANSDNLFNGGEIVIRNLEFSNYVNIGPPPLGGSAPFSLSPTVTMDLSLDSGVTFSSHTTTALLDGTILHSSDVGTTEYYDTEMISMSLSGGTFPPLFAMRLSPVALSPGIIITRPVGGYFEMNSFFDLEVQVSIDGGVIYYDEDNGATTLIEAESVTSIPTLSEWGLISLATLLLIFGVFYLRRNMG